MTAIAVIEPNSQAARYLVRRIGALATGTKLGIEIRVDGVAFKVGDEAWTPTLATLHEPTEPLNEGTYAVSVLEHGGWRQFAVAHGSEAQAILDNSETPNQLRFDRIE